MNNLIVIAGPTAVGKTKTAIEVAKHFDTEIISADSRQIFIEPQIGTAVPSQEELNQVKHYLIGTKHVTEYYNAWLYEQEALNIAQSIFQKRNVAILAGGSGLYIDAVCNGIDEIPDIDPELRAHVQSEYETKGIQALRLTLQILDPEYYNIVDLSNPARIKRAIEICLQAGIPYSQLRKAQKKERPFNCIKIALNLPREELYNKINSRVDQMIADGLENEVRKLSQYQDCTALKTVGYREFFDFFAGKCTRDEAIEKIKQNTRKYAKKQITWLNRSNDYTWFSPYEVEKVIDFCEKNIR